MSTGKQKTKRLSAAERVAIRTDLVTQLGDEIERALATGKLVEEWQISSRLPVTESLGVMVGTFCTNKIRPFLCDSRLHLFEEAPWWMSISSDERSSFSPELLVEIWKNHACLWGALCMTEDAPVHTEGWVADEEVEEWRERWMSSLRVGAEKSAVQRAGVSDTAAVLVREAIAHIVNSQLSTPTDRKMSFSGMNGSSYTSNARITALLSKVPQGGRNDKPSIAATSPVMPKTQSSSMRAGVFPSPTPTTTRPTAPITAVDVQRRAMPESSSSSSSSYSAKPTPRMGSKEAYLNTGRGTTTATTTAKENGTHNHEEDVEDSHENKEEMDEAMSETGVGDEGADPKFMDMEIHGDEFGVGEGKPMSAENSLAGIMDLPEMHELSELSVSANDSAAAPAPAAEESKSKDEETDEKEEKAKKEKEKPPRFPVDVFFLDHPELDAEQGKSAWNRLQTSKSASDKALVVEYKKRCDEMRADFFERNPKEKERLERDRQKREERARLEKGQPEEKKKEEPKKVAKKEETTTTKKEAPKKAQAPHKKEETKKTSKREEVEVEMVVETASGVHAASAPLQLQQQTNKITNYSTKKPYPSDTDVKRKKTQAATREVVEVAHSSPPTSSSSASAVHISELEERVALLEVVCKHEMAAQKRMMRHHEKLMGHLASELRCRNGELKASFISALDRTLNSSSSSSSTTKKRPGRHQQQPHKKRVRRVTNLVDDVEEDLDDDDEEVLEDEEEDDYSNDGETEESDEEEEAEEDEDDDEE